MVAFVGAALGCDAQPSSMRPNLAGDDGPAGLAGSTGTIPTGAGGGAGTAGSRGGGAAGAPNPVGAAGTGDPGRGGEVDASAPDAGAPDAGVAVGEGADAATESCVPGRTRCQEGCLVTCQSDGVWGPIVKCGGRKTCTEAGPMAHCVCKEDRACLAVGTSCTSQSEMSTCAQDQDGCFFETAPLETCASGACLGAPGRATCCATSCTDHPTRCEARSDGVVLGTCAIGPDGCATFARSQCAGGTICERFAPAACVDPQWAEWPMPNAAADVAAGAPNLASFTDNLDHTVTDNVTGLMWTDFPIEFATVEEADTFCHMLSQGTDFDWRLPSIIELISIADFSSLEPSIDSNFFPASVVPPGFDFFIWSSTEFEDGSGSHYAINYFRSAVVPIRPDDSSFGGPRLAYCVR